MHFHLVILDLPHTTTSMMIELDQVNNHFAEKTPFIYLKLKFSKCKTFFNAIQFHSNSALSSPCMMYPFHQASTVFTFIIILFTIATNEATFSDCNKTFSCGHLENISHPFTGGDRPEYCSHPDFQLTCNGNSIPELTINSFRYRVIQLNQTKKTLTLSRSDIYDTPCILQKPASTNLHSSFFKLGSNNKELTLFYGCNSDESLESYMCDTGVVNFHVEDGYDIDDMKCNAGVTVPVLESSADKLIDVPSSLKETLREGFSVEYDNPSCNNCIGSDRYCGFQEQKGNEGFVCICGDKICTESKSNTKPVVIGAAVGGAALICIIAGFFLFFLIKRRKQAVAQSKSKDISAPTSSQGLPNSSTTIFSRSTPYTSMSSDPEKGSDYFGVMVFKYSELEEATNCFDPSRELGDGGFGTVYYGELSDGRVVAVKRLYENNCKRVVQFMNEVEILTRLKHPNLVQLYGCTSRRSRELILVYEYIPNGTVADHLHGKQAESGLLNWNLRLGIAIETAAALAYLHASDIIHRDVKTNNILLDKNFTVKVADFGLSRLFPNDVTHVSTAPQGTPGYVDPEYYQCYQLNDKSDVYSFGVVLVELISSKQAVDISRHRHDINLATMAVNKIQCHALHELVDLSLGFDSDFSVRRTMILVAELAFRCLQQEKDMRPSMEEVLNILEGIRNEQCAGKAEVMDINREDDVGLLKSDACPFSSDSSDTDKWISSSITSEKWVSSSTTT